MEYTAIAVNEPSLRALLSVVLARLVGSSSLSVGAPAEVARLVVYCDEPIDLAAINIASINAISVIARIEQAWWHLALVRFGDRFVDIGTYSVAIRGRIADQIVLSLHIGFRSCGDLRPSAYVEFFRPTLEPLGTDSDGNAPHSRYDRELWKRLLLDVQRNHALYCVKDLPDETGEAITPGGYADKDNHCGYLTKCPEGDAKKYYCDIREGTPKCRARSKNCATINLLRHQTSDAENAWFDLHTISALRDFRDLYLMQTREARKYVGWYYLWSEYALRTPAAIVHQLQALKRAITVVGRILHGCPDTEVISYADQESFLQVLADHRAVECAVFRDALSDAEVTIGASAGLTKREFLKRFGLPCPREIESAFACANGRPRFAADSVADRSSNV